MRILTTFELNKLYKKCQLQKPHIKSIGLDDGQRQWQMRFILVSGEVVGVSTNFNQKPYTREKIYYSFDTINLMIRFIREDLDD